MNNNAPEDKTIKLNDEDEIDGCTCDFHDAEQVPDEDLPASIGGVE